MEGEGEGEGERVWKLETSQRENYGGGERNVDVVICRHVSVQGKELSSLLYIPSAFLFFSLSLFLFQAPLSLGNPHPQEINTTTNSAFL